MYLELILNNLKQENNEEPEEVKHEEEESRVVPQCFQICLDSCFMFLQTRFCNILIHVLNRVRNVLR